MTTETYGTEFFAGRREMVLPSAYAVSAVVYDLLKPESILDVGCGQGEWLEAFGLEDAVGVDIAAPEGVGFLRHDLSEPLDLHRTFDLVICLEVGEHLPPEVAETLIDTLERHGDTVLFSAAVPGQQGTGHINCQPHAYWYGLFVERGYSICNMLRPLIAHDQRISSWYRDNIFLALRLR